MAQVIAAPDIEFRAGMDAKLQALAKLEALSEELGAEVARQQSNECLREAVGAWRTGDFARCGQLALDATRHDDANPKAYHVLAMALERMGYLHKALVTYERAVQLAPDDPELLIDIGMTAWRLKMGDTAVNLFRRYIAARPDSALGYNNLGSVLGQIGDCTSAIGVLHDAIQRMPAEAILWNSLATILADDGRAEESVVFYQEALRLNPAFPRFYHNLGFAYSHLGMLPQALEAYDEALARMVDPQERLEAHHSRSICLIGMGRLEEGFAEYEYRNHERFRAYVPHMLKAPQWQGEPLAGKRLLVAAEQGLGDELMFANTLPDLVRAVGPEGTLQVAVDPRLATLFKRSFPGAEIGSCEDRTRIDVDGNQTLRYFPFAEKDGEPDCYTLMGSTLRFLRRRIEDFPHDAFLRPDPERVAQYREMLRTGGSQPIVGICWRSMKLEGKRAKYYSGLESWGPIFRTPGVRFVNLQYGDVGAELADARRMHEIPIEEVDGLDLKNDIDGSAALSAALDLVISAPTASAAIAGSVGAEVWFLTAGRTWPQLGTDEYPWYRKTRVFCPAKFGDWNEVMPRVGDALAEFTASKNRAT
jgi:tetratricopeptide (TPR) repeat protein